MTFQPCFLAVEKRDRMSAKSIATSTERKPPELHHAPVALGFSQAFPEVGSMAAIGLPPRFYPQLSSFGRGGRERLSHLVTNLRSGRYGRRAAPLARRLWFARTFCR
jgi:hypothetical protein